MPVKKLVSYTDIGNYMPGKITASSNPETWNSIKLDIHKYPSKLEDGPIPPTSHHILGFITYGHVTGECSLNENRWVKYDLKTNYNVMLPAGQTINWRWSPIKKDCLQGTNLYLPPKIITDIAENDFNLKTTQIELNSKICYQDNFIKHLNLQLKYEIENNRPLGRLFAESISQTLGIYLLMNYCVTHYKNQNSSNHLYKRTLHQVLDYCRDRYNEEISLRQLASIANLSESHFLRVFKKSVGKTPTQYIIEYRIEKAKQLLKNTRWSILAIGLEVGYNSPSHFTMLFKRYTGITPKQYRNSINKTGYN